MIQYGNGMIGFFDNAEQSDPTYDPPHNAPCVVCGEPVCHPMKTISLMWQDGADNKSYFYRSHKACYEKNPAAADKAALDLIQGMVQ